MRSPKTPALLLVPAFLLLVPTLAHAAYATGAMTVGDIAGAATGTTSDWSGLGLLRKVFGDIATNPLNPSGGQTVLGQVFQILNLSLMAIGSIWMIYTTTAGVAQTAHEGELLGRRFSTLWTPIRMVTGTVAIVPVFNGYSIAQLIMLWFAMLGVGIANLGWDAGAQFLANGGDIVVATMPARDTRATAQAVFESELCVASKQSQAQLDNAENQGNPMYVQVDPASFGGTENQGKTGYQWGNLKANGGWGDASCGSVTYPTSYASAMSNGTLGVMDNWAGGGLNNIQAAGQSAAINAFKALDREAIAAAQALTSSIATNLYNMNQQLHPVALPVAYQSNVVTQMALDYEHNLKNNIANAAQAMSPQSYSARNMLANVASTSQAMGFTSAGAWYSTLASISTSMEHAMAAAVTPGQPPQPPRSGTIYETALKDVAMIDQVNAGAINQTVAAAPAAAPSGAVDRVVQWFAGKLCSNSQTSAAINTAAGVSSPGQCLVDGLTGGTADPSANALIRLKNAGDYLVDAGAIGITAVGAAEGVENSLPGKLTQGLASIFTAGASNAVVGAIGAWGSILKTLFESLIFFGLVLSIWLPMLPFVVWVGAVATWLAVVVEAVVAAPLWAFAHMDAEGEGMGQRTSHGYLFILNVLFRPFLMVVGFLMMTIIIQVIGSLWLYMFPMAVASVQVDSITGLISVIGFVTVFTMGSMAVVNIGANMISMIPNNVLSWIGGTMINNFGEGMQQHANTSVNNGLQQVKSEIQRRKKERFEQLNGVQV